MTPAVSPSPTDIDDIRLIVGDAHARPALLDDAIDGVAAQWVVEPASEAELSRVLCVANAAKLRVVARGSGTKLNWGNPPRSADIVVSTRRLDRVIDHAAGDMTATVQAGCTVGALNLALAQQGQRLALDPLWPDRATVGGILATNDSGALRAAFGTLRDHLIGITAVLADGTIAKSGGKVVKNVAGYDLPKLFTGSFGTLGVMTEATFRLYPSAHCTRGLRFSVPAHEALGNVISAMDRCSPVVKAVQIDASDDAPPGIAVLIEGLADAIEPKARRVIGALAECGCQHIVWSDDAWTARERLFSDPESAVAKVSFLPTQWPDFVEQLRQAATAHGIRWSIVGQAVGVAMVSFSGAPLDQIGAAFIALRRHLEKLDGSLVLLRCPRALKSIVDVWPQAGSALPLMRRIKDQFDPGGILAPGRFVGGI